MRLTSLTSILLLASLSAAYQFGQRELDDREEVMLESIYFPVAAFAHPNEAFCLVKKFSENGWKDHGQAVQQGDFQKVMNTIQNGVDLDSGIPLMEVKDQVTALMLAVHYGNVEMVRFLLKNHANPNVISPLHSLTALHMAAASPNASAQLCSLLLESGANPMGLDENHLSPLFIAAANPNGQKALEIIKAYSSINRESLLMAIEMDDTEEIIRQVLFGECRYRGEQKLLFQLLGKFHCQALKHNDAKLVLLLSKMLIQKFPDCINECDVLGRTALHYASACDPTGEIIELLIDNGASPSFKDASRNRSLHYLPTTHVKYHQLSELYKAANPQQVNQVLVQLQQNPNSIMSIIPPEMIASGFMPYCQYNCAHPDLDESSEEEDVVMVNPGEESLRKMQATVLGQGGLNADLVAQIMQMANQTDRVISKKSDNHDGQ